MRAYFGGEFESDGGGGGVVLAGGVVLSEGGGIVVVVPGGAVDWSLAGGVVDVSAGGELADPAGEVDSCLEQADMSASAPTHNNRTLRFIRSPHYCNGTGTDSPDLRAAGRVKKSQVAFQDTKIASQSGSGSN